MKKILVYNWIPFDEKLNKGGGVTVYTRNLIKSLLDSGLYDVYFLSSGRAYNLMRPGVYIERTENVFGEKCKSYQVVNSPVLSSAHLSFLYLKDYINDSKLLKVMKEFVEELGGFDVIHFQNLEGLSLSVLELKKSYPNMQMIYSMHNYFPICPQVMLWRGDKENCNACSCGEKCLDCVPKDVYRWKVIFNQSINYRLERAKQNEPKSLVRKVQKLLDSYCTQRQGIREKGLLKRKNEFAQVFAEFESKNVEYLNLYMDKILVVSKRVGEIARNKGMCSDKIHVSYIGTDVAKRQCEGTSYPYDGKQFNICYLGYMRTMKGFYFLLDALERMEPSVASKVGVRFAAKITDSEAEKRIEKLGSKFCEVKLYDGYTHENLPEILNGVQMGIVPVLWEDNLPQVAIEMKAFGIPVLTSNLGGAKELTQSEDFVFEAGNIDAFLLCLNGFVNGQKNLDDYWIENKKLVTMEEHIQELNKFYS